MLARDALAALILAPLAIGCTAAASEETEGSVDAIVGGTRTESVPAIGYLVATYEDQGGPPRLRGDGNGGNAFVATTPLCTGTLIARNVVLTAAHCVDAETEASLRANAGEYRYTGVAFGIGAVADGRTIAVTRSVIHPEYARDRLDHDLAYLVLAEDVTDVPIATVRRSRHRGACNYVGTGYGIDKDGYHKTEDTYSPDEVGTRRSLALCADAGYEDGMIRAYAGARGSICQGDSGGPLRVANTRELVGVLSYNKNLCAGYERGFYVPLARNLPFVDEALRAR